MNRLLALEIESHAKENEISRMPLFDNNDIQTYLLGLGVVYEEAFIISTHHHIAAWVVGEHQGLLINSFQKYDEPLCRVNLFLNNDSARSLFHQIVVGNRWNEINHFEKLNRLMSSRDIAMRSDCLGPVISDLVTKTSNEINALPFMIACEESWSLKNEIVNLSTSYVTNRF
ncbi:MAG TPA: hypothetical protein VIM65_06480 [Cyclobacteriaceae bacterium]